MPAAMHLTVLVSLFAVCTGVTTSSSAKHMPEITTSSAQPNLILARQNSGSLSAVTATDVTHQPSTTTDHSTIAVSPEKVSLSSSTSPQTPSKTEETHTSTPSSTNTTNQTSNGTVSPGTTLSPESTSPDVTATTTLNPTSPVQTAARTEGAGPSPAWDQGDLAKNPGLVAILCIFCIVVALVLVVVTVKCIRSPRSNFERLEDVPMGKVNEESPFAKFSK